MYDRSRGALIAQLGEHSTGIAEVVGLNPAQSLNFFQVSVLIFFSDLPSSSVAAALDRHHSIATNGQNSFHPSLYLLLSKC